MSHAFDTPEQSQRNINFKRKWLAAHQLVRPNGCLEQTIQSLKNVEEKNLLPSNQMPVIYRIQDFQPLYVGKSVEKILGYSQEEFLSWPEGAFMKIGAYNQPTYFPNALKWKNIFAESSPHRHEPANIISHACGVNYLCKDGSTCRFIIRQAFVTGKNFILPEFDLVYFEDVTHMLKGDDYWLLFESSQDASDSYSKFFTKESSDNYPITIREKEILSLIANGKTSKELAAELNISPDTVSQHRKNMIRKMMARDTSTLIQICKICGII